MASLFALVMTLAGLFASGLAGSPARLPGSPAERSAPPFALAASSDPVFTALLVDGHTLAGRIVSLGPGAIRLQNADGVASDLPLDRLIRLSREAAAPPAMAELAHVILAEGDRLMRVAIGSTTDTDLEVQSDLLGKLEVPLDSLVGLVMSTAVDDSTFEGWWDRVLKEPRSSEVVWLSNGDRLTGEFLGLDARKVKLQVEGKTIEVDRSGVVAVGFDPALVSYPRPRSDFMEITLRDGTRLGVTAAKFDDNLVVAQTRLGRTIRFPLGELTRVQSRSASIVYLTERKLARERYVPYIGPTRVYRRDRTVEGRSFHLGGQVYGRGVGTQSRTLLAYELEADDHRFQALVGVDERAGPSGSVIFRVLTDKGEQFTSPPLTQADSPRPIDIDLTGAKHLVLVTDFGDRGDVRDIADWVEARIIRVESKHDRNNEDGSRRQ
jgi:hypothetical protein